MLARIVVLQVSRLALMSPTAAQGESVRCRRSVTPDELSDARGKVEEQRLAATGAADCRLDTP